MIEQLVFVAYLTLYIYLYYTLSLSDGLLFTAAARKKRDNDDHDVFQPCMIKIRKQKLHNLYEKIKAKAVQINMRVIFHKNDILNVSWDY